MKKLAYPIQKKSTGFYQLFEFKADPAFIAKLETEFRRDEKVIRFMTVKLDKFAVEYSSKRKRLQKEKNRKGGISHGTKFKRNQISDSTVS
jgi:small subunit ribosomal protein S6